MKAVVISHCACTQWEEVGTRAAIQATPDHASSLFPLAAAGAEGHEPLPAGPSVVKRLALGETSSRQRGLTPG